MVTAGAALSAALTVAFMASGCVRETEGARMGLSATVGAPEALAGEGDASFTAPDGARITLSSGHLNLTGWELLPCPTAGQHLPGGDALAHTEGSPTQWGEPMALDLTAAAPIPLSLGVIHPPPGAWCSLLLHVGPADGDGAGLPEGDDLTGLSLRLVGSVLAPGAREASPLDLRGESVNITLLSLGPAGVTLEGETPWGDARLHLDPAALFADLPLALDPIALEDRIQSNLGRALSLPEARASGPP